MCFPDKRYRSEGTFRFAAGLVLFLASLLVTGGCGRPREERSLIRVIDEIGPANILQTPLRSPDPNNPSLVEVSGQKPLEDRGTGANPYLIKKKLDIGPTDINALTAMPPTRLEFKVAVPSEAVLEFACGIFKDEEFSRGASGGRTVTFIVSAATPDGEERLFEREVILEPGGTLAFKTKKIDLVRLAGKDVVFRLTTEGDGRALAFWSNPVIYRKRTDARYVILISLDTLRADHLGCYGYPRDTSPNMDRLAGDSVLFADTTAPSAWTLPSHMSLMTSLNSAGHGMNGVGRRLAVEIPTLAELLKNHGFYNTAFTGGGFVDGTLGFNRGFESYHKIENPTSEEAAASLGVMANRWIEENLDRDFFLFLHTYQIHDPYDSEERFRSLFAADESSYDSIYMGRLGFSRRRRFEPVPESMRRNWVDLYDSEIRAADEGLIGPLVAQLKALGIYDRTMIVLTSDHGDEFFEHGGWLHSHSLYEEIVRVPLIVKFFGSRESGKRIADPVRLIDAAPTILEELGIPDRFPGADGKSLLALAAGRGSARREERIGMAEVTAEIGGEHLPKKKAVRLGSFKLIINEPFSAENLEFFSPPPPPPAAVELFDLASDPGETRNLAAERPDLVRRLLEKLEASPGASAGPAASGNGKDEDLLRRLKSLGYL
ncbi:MAG: sulfatase [Candidatus Aminicenantales bacterium]